MPFRANRESIVSTQLVRRNIQSLYNCIPRKRRCQRGERYPRSRVLSPTPTHTHQQHSLVRWFVRSSVRCCCVVTVRCRGYHRHCRRRRRLRRRCHHYLHHHQSTTISPATTALTMAAVVVAFTKRERTTTNSVHCCKPRTHLRLDNGRRHRRTNEASRNRSAHSVHPTCPGIWR